MNAARPPIDAHAAEHVSFHTRLLRALFLLSLAFLFTPAAGTQQADHGKELAACINKEVHYQRTNWNDSVLHDSPANVHLEHVWLSARPRRFEFTVITQLTIDRLPALFNQCTTFRGPLSAAVYLALLEPDAEPSEGATFPAALSESGKYQVASAVKTLEAVHKQAELADGCQLDLHFFWEAFDEARTMILYPVNALRNFARMQVRTKLLAAVDVDMLISTSLSRLLEDPKKIAWLEAETAQRKVFVLPAFEPPRSGVVGRSMADRIAEAPKDVLENMYHRKLAQQFKVKVFVRGHAPTQYHTFFGATAPYPVAYKAMFEPWFITTWDTMAWFDVRFRGYGLNKIQHVASTVYYGHTFHVMDSAWLVHRPHADTESRKVVARQAANVNQLGMKLSKLDIYWKVTELYRVAKLGMMRGTFAPVLDARMVRCQHSLAWLQPLLERNGSAVDPKTFT